MSTIDHAPAMKRPCATEADNARLRATIAEYEASITWDKTCLNCASLLDQNYTDYVRAEKAEQKLAAIQKAAVEDAAQDDDRLRAIISILGGQV